MVENTLYLDWTRDVLDTETEGLREIAAALDHDFVRVAEVLLHCKGRVVITDMGRSGHIGRRMATTMASTGTPTFFVHPAETAYGGLGMIVDHDVVIVISNSDESDEITVIIPALKHKNIIFICTTAHPTPTMARRADIYITAAVSRETCPLGLALASSTTIVMALGSALAVVLSCARAFMPDDFALDYPVGSLGKRLLLCAADAMHKDEVLSVVLLDTPSKKAVIRMSEKGSGMLAVIDAEGRLKGVFTDSGSRRLSQERDNFAGLKVGGTMHASPKTISADCLATEALKVMQGGHMDGLLIVEENGVLIGTLSMHGLLVARVVWIDGKNVFRRPYTRIGCLK